MDEQVTKKGMNKYLMGTLIAVVVSIVVTYVMSLLLYILQAPFLGIDVIMNNLSKAMMISGAVSVVVGFIMTVCFSETFGGDKEDVGFAFGFAAAVVTVIVCLIMSIALKDSPKPSYTPTYNNYDNITQEDLDNLEFYYEMEEKWESYR